MTYQEAIKTIRELMRETNDSWYEETYSMAIEALSCSEKPNESDLLTDKEQRIFLAAMGRERKVCKQMDDEWRDCREPYEDSLVWVCNEIERKVKGALWTTV